MAVLLELKEKLKKIYNQYDTYIVPAAKFVVALFAFIMINVNIGYMAKLKNPIIAVLLSIVCAFLPSGVTLVLLSLFMLAHLYAISIEFALLALCIILLMYLLYFRFTPKSAYLLILSAICCCIKLPYILPVAVGLCFSALAVIPVGFGIIMFYIIKIASDYEIAISNQSLDNSMQQISYLIESLLQNKQLIVLIMAVTATIVVVYVVRRLKIDYSWEYAIGVGSVLQFIVLILGQIALSAGLNIVLIILGVVLGAAIAFVCKTVFFALDYRRTEYVQYEDDEYYYYVKAVPKINVANADVKVKQINAKKTKKAADIKDVRKTEPDKKSSNKPKSKVSTKQAMDEDDDIIFEDD